MFSLPELSELESQLKKIKEKTQNIQTFLNNWNYQRSEKWKHQYFIQRANQKQQTYITSQHDDISMGLQYFSCYPGGNLAALHK